MRRKYFLRITVIIIVVFLLAKGHVAHAADRFSALTIGGSNNDTINSIVQTSDGGYAAAGYTASYGAGGNDVYVVKFTSAGALDTSFGTGGTLTLGGAGDDSANSIVQTSEGGYIVAGYTNSYGAGNYDLYIIKLTSAGALDTSFGTGGTLTLGGAGNEQARSIIQTTDGGYALAGYSDSYGAGSTDVYIVKFTSVGALDTSFGTNGTRTAGGNLDDAATSIVQTTDGGYAIAGNTYSYGAGGSDFYIIKFTSVGALDTSFGTGGTRTVGGASTDIAKSIIQTTDGGYAAAGYTNSYGAGDYDAYVVKFTSAGDLDTSFGTGGTRTIGGTAYDSAASIIQTTDGGYAFAGDTTSYGTLSSNFYIAKLTSSGALNTSFGTGGTLTVSSFGSTGDNANSIIQTTDGGYAVAGDPVVMHYSDGFIIKLDTAGSMGSSCSNATGYGGVLGSGGAINSGGTLSNGGTLGSGGGAIGSGGTISEKCSVSISLPTVATEEATDIAADAATANANLSDTGGENPNRLIQYGTTSGVYTNSCAAGTGDVGDFSCAMTSLSPSTTYYVRAEAINFAGTSYGTEMNFTTTDIAQLVAPVVDSDSSNPFDDCQPKTLKAKAVSSSEIKLKWKDNCSGEDGYIIERETAKGKFKKIDSVGENKNSYTDKGLLSKKKYTYRVKAYEGHDKTGHTNKSSATTLAVMTPTKTSRTHVSETTPASTDNPSEATVTTSVDTLNVPGNSNGESLSVDKINKNPEKKDSIIAQEGKVLGDFIESPAGQKTSAAVTGLGILVGAIVAAATSAIPLIASSSGGAPFASGLPKRFSFFGIMTPREKKINWGVVFDIDTHRPIAGALVSILNAEERVVDSMTTNMEGKFGFLAAKGGYTFRISKKDYALFTEKNTDDFYGKIYDGKIFTIENDDVAETNIAIRSTKIDWRELSKRKLAIYKMALSIIGRHSLLVLFYGCFVISATILYVSPSTFNAFTVAVYVVIIAHNLFFKVKKYGLITDQRGEPLPFTMVSIYAGEQHDRRAAFAISDILGRYFVLAKDDKYLMKMQGQTRGGASFGKSFDINVRDGVFRRDVVIKGE